jgi:hypothetical protein
MNDAMFLSATNGGTMRKALILLATILAGTAMADYVVESSQQRIFCTITGVDSLYVWTMMPNRTPMAFLLADVSALEVSSAVRRDSLEHALGRSRVSIVLIADTVGSAVLTTPAKKESVPPVLTETTSAMKAPVASPPQPETAAAVGTQPVTPHPPDTTHAISPQALTSLVLGTTATVATQPTAPQSSDARRAFSDARAGIRNSRQLVSTSDALLAACVLTALIGIAEPVFAVAAVSFGVAVAVTASEALRKLDDTGVAVEHAAAASGNSP